MLLFNKPVLSPAEWILSELMMQYGDRPLAKLTISSRNPAPIGLAEALEELKSRGWLVVVRDIPAVEACTTTGLGGREVITVISICGV